MLKYENTHYFNSLLFFSGLEEYKGGSAHRVGRMVRLSSEYVPTQRACRVVTCAEPAINTNGVELFLASFATEFW
jgi:hypothetical protein